MRGTQQHEEVDGEEEEGYEEEGEYDARQDPRLGPFAAANTARVATTAVSSAGPDSAGPRQTPPLPQSPQPKQPSPQRLQQQQQAGARPSPAPGRTEDVADLLSTKMLQVGGGRRSSRELTAGCHGRTNLGMPVVSCAKGERIWRLTSGRNNASTCLPAPATQGWALLDKYCPRCDGTCRCHVVWYRSSVCALSYAAGSAVVACGRGQ